VQGCGFRTSGGSGRTQRGRGGDGGGGLDTVSGVVILGARPVARRGCVTSTRKKFGEGFTLGGGGGGQYLDRVGCGGGGVCRDGGRGGGGGGAGGFGVGGLAGGSGVWGMRLCVMFLCRFGEKGKKTPGVSTPRCY